MAKTNKRHIRANSNDKLKALRDQLRMCTVVLHNVALDKDLVRLYHSAFSGKKKKLEHTTPCINASENSNNVWMLKENVHEDNMQDEIPRVTRNRLKKLTKKEMEECKDVELSDNLLYNQFYKMVKPEFLAQKRQVKCDDSIKSFSSKSNDDISSMSSNTYCSHTQKKTVPSNSQKPLIKSNSNKRLSVQKINKIKGISMKSIKINSDDENYLNKKNLTSTDVSNKMQEVSDEFVKKYNSNNLCTVGVTNGTICRVRLEHCLERNQNSKTVFSNIINTDIENKKNFGTSEDNKADFKSKNVNFSNNCFTICNNSINGTQNQKDAATRASNKTISLTLNSTVTTDVLKSFALKSKEVKTNDKTVFSTADNTITTGVLESFTLKSSCPTVSETNVTKIQPDLLTTCNKKQCVNKTNNKKTKESLPKITEDHILPKGTIKFIKVNISDKGNAEDFLKQNEHSDINSNTKHISYNDDTLDFTNILKEKEYDEMDNSIDTLRISEFTTVINNNIDLKNKNIDYNKLHNIPQKINKSIDFLIEGKNNVHNNVNINNAKKAEINKNCTLNREERANELNDEEHKNDLLKDDETILNENTLNLVDLNGSYNVNGSSIFVTKEEIAKQNRKRIAEENSIDIKLNNKKRRLNRTIWLHNNVTCAKSLNYQQLNDFPGINTMETAGLNIAEKNNVELDLRKHLNKKRSKQSPKQLTFEHKLNNNSIDPKPINLNNKKDDKKITPISTTKNEKFRKRLFFETEPILDKTLLVKEKTLPDEEKDIQVDLVCNNYTHSHSASPLSTSEETQHLSQIDKNIGENINVQEKHTNSKNEDDYDDDCISLFAESFDTNLCETTFLNEQDKSNKSLHSDAPYIMTTSSFNKFVKQNATEFNKEYAKYVESNIQTSNKTCETNREVNRQLRQTTDCMPETTLKVTSLETKKEEILKYPWSTKIDLKNMIVGYCFCILKKGICHKSIQCRFQHDLQTLIRTVCSEDPRAILDVIRNALHLGYNFFCRRIYLNSMAKLTIDQILIMYQMFHEIRPFYSKDEFTIAAKKYIIHDVINELLKRQLSLKTIVSQMIEYIMLTKDPINLMNMLVCIEQYVKHGEYWNTVKSLILRLPPDKFIIEKILRECIENENLIDVQDVNKNLINKVHPKLILQLDKNILERFKRLTEKVAKNSHSTLLIQNFGENLSETIASPDGNTNLSQTEFPRYDVTVANKIKDQETEVNGKTYILRPIDDLPEPRSIYRDHNHLWKFYVDLDRFKKGLSHQDYDYVIKILKKYAEKDENTFFVHSCCKILRTEVKRSEYHLANIIRRTGNKYFNTTQST
ncbi:uncharacterized protein PF11_0213 isoform X1 [Monomorium pharaonis]|uniref:uncharacterized protein PF11_0213 isoform X1 n=1 Tax=Monomorium pharaonis TaxID=307658 RepID=UPI001746F4EC|nr:uncharacterized protein PF11_0213 isoform X1 [Monomorium pharaonis]